MAVWGDDLNLEGNYVPALSRTLILLVATSMLCFASIPIDIIDTDPNFGLPANNSSVFGNPQEYAIQSFSLAGPSGGGTVGTWTLTIDTNYGVNPVGDSSMPVFCDNGGTFMGGSNPCPGSIPYFMSDFLIQQGTGASATYFGIVMSTGHVDYGSPGYSDSYVAGNLYSADGFQDSQQGNPTAGPVILETAGKTLEDTSGSLSVALNKGTGGASCAGNDSLGALHNCALYQVTDTFTVGPADTFFNPAEDITIYASSADCFNASLVLTTPEPSGLIWMIPGLLLLGAYLRRRSLARVN